MIEVKAIRKFTHGGETLRKGDPLRVANKRQADALEAKGLANVVGEVKADDPPAKDDKPAKPAKKAAKKSGD